MLIVVSVFAPDPETKPDKASQPTPAQQPHRIQVDEGVQKARLVRVVSPVYPPVLGKRMDGTVVLHVIVGKNGSVKSAQPVLGLPNLRDSAVNAVLQWQYEPTLVNGVAVEVDTTVSVVFPPLAKQESPEPKTGMLCVIPDPPGCCTRVNIPFDLKTLMFSIDNGEKTAWPQRTGLKIEGLSLGEKHLVVVYSGGKSIQSFRFHFKDYNKTELCLLFDGYGGPDLRPVSKSCGCK
jgi:TonB family protein